MDSGAPVVSLRRPSRRLSAFRASRTHCSQRLRHESRVDERAA